MAADDNILSLTLANDAGAVSFADVVGDGSRQAALVDGALTKSRVCTWCEQQLPTTQSYGRFCSQRCRQSAFRLRRRLTIAAHDGKPLKFAYADPPYPGLARKRYGKEASYAGEVDHAALVSSLRSGYDGWALSTSARALRDILPLCPPGARVCAWVKPIGARGYCAGLYNTWEPLIVVPGRRLRPGKRDWMAAQPARGGGKLMGRKPIAFCAWLFSLLGMLPGDTFDDLFPGTGIVARCWRHIERSVAQDLNDAVSSRGCDEFPLFPE